MWHWKMEKYTAAAEGLLDNGKCAEMGAAMV
jgi:hypothetical protein